MKNNVKENWMRFKYHCLNNRHEDKEYHGMKEEYLFVKHIDVEDNSDHMIPKGYSINWLIRLRKLNYQSSNFQKYRIIYDRPYPSPHCRTISL